MSNTERAMMLSQGQQKITLQHQERLACIYIRQSSPGQVRHNKESQVNQYQLGQRAELLGWSQERISVIDCDLGLSGKDSVSREGFKELVGEVSLGHVGIIFGYEVSRLARNNADWYHLLDSAALFGTLIADYDGIYDPRLFNDRLLLGLKGTNIARICPPACCACQMAQLSKIRMTRCATRLRQSLPSSQSWGAAGRWFLICSERAPCCHVVSNAVPRPVMSCGSQRGSMRSTPS